MHWVYLRVGKETLPAGRYKECDWPETEPSRSSGAPLFDCLIASTVATVKIAWLIPLPGIWRRPPSLTSQPPLPAGYRPPRAAASARSSSELGLSQSAPLKNLINSPATIGCFHPLVSSRFRTDG